MSLDFVQQIAAVGRRIERRRLLAAASWSVAAVVAAALALMGLDWLLGVDHLAARALLTVLLAVALAAIVSRAWQAVRGRVATLDVALELERRHPELSSLLASGVEFSSQDDGDVTAGSADLRRAVVVRAAVAAESIDLGAAAAREPFRRAVTAAAVAFAAFGATGAISPQGLTAGVQRLVNPLSDAEWPRRHDLAFIDAPSRLAIGGDFQTALRDRRGPLPAAVEVEYRVRRQGRWHYEMQTYAADGDTVEVRWPNVQESFEYRARGGDHRSMPWRQVVTAEAPEVQSLGLTVQPPAYTHLPADKLDEPLRIFQGSAVALEGQTSVPIASGELQSEGAPAVPLEVKPGGQEFSVAAGRWRPAATAEWTFALTTSEGLTTHAKRKLRIEVAPDAPPTATIAQPTAGLAVLPQAHVELTVDAQDDVGLQAVDLALAPSEATPAETTPAAAAAGVGGAAKAQAIELWRASDKTAANGSPPATAQQLRHVLELPSLPATPGTTWDVRAQATDIAGQVSASPRPLRLRIINREEFLRQTDAQLARLVAALERALDDQRNSQRRVVAWTAEGAESPSADEMLAAVAGQRQIGGSLAGSPEAAAALAVVLAADYQRNQFDGNDAPGRLERLAEELESLAATTLPGIAGRLNEFARGRQQPTAAQAALTSTERELLAAVERSQSDVLAALEAAIREWSRRSDAQQFQRELVEIKAEQARLQDQTQALGELALQDDPQISMAEREQRARPAAAAQRALAARLASTIARIEQAAAAEADAAPTDAARLSAVIETAVAANVQSKVRAAADHLAAHRFGQAGEQQRQAGEALEQMLDRLAGSGGVERGAERLKKLDDAERELQTLRRKTQQLVARQQAAPQQPADEPRRRLERLELERRELAQQTGELAQRLEQLQAVDAAQAAQKAAEQLARRDGDPQADQAAERELAEAQRQLRAERQRQQSLLARQQIEQLDAVLRRLVAAQQAVVDEIERLAGLRADDGSLTPAQQASVGQLADRQAAVREQSRHEAEGVEQFPLFARLLRTAAATMQEAAAELAKTGAGDAAQRPATQALAELRLLADAVREHRRQPTPPKDQDQAGQPQQGEGKKQNDNAAQVQALQLAVAQLGLLRTLQVDLERRTAELEQRHGAGEIDAAAFGESSKNLSAEQRELTALAETLVREIELPAEESLLPDLDEALEKSLEIESDADREE